MKMKLAIGKCNWKMSSGHIVFLLIQTIYDDTVAGDDECYVDIGKGLSV